MLPQFSGQTYISENYASCLILNIILYTLNSHVRTVSLSTQGNVYNTGIRTEASLLWSKFAQDWQSSHTLYVDFEQNPILCFPVQEINAIFFLFYIYMYHVTMYMYMNSWAFFFFSFIVV